MVLLDSFSIGYPPFIYYAMVCMKSPLNQQFLFSSSFFLLAGKNTRVAKGKECNSNQDCVLIADTSCVKDYDHVNRCLCGNYESPRNGICEKGPKGVRHRCNNDNDCDEYMVCKENNSTRGTFVGSYGRNTMTKES